MKGIKLWLQKRREEVFHWLTGQIKESQTLFEKYLGFRCSANPFERRTMNWKRGINRLVWAVSSLVASFVLLYGLINASTNEEAAESFFLAAAAFGFVWLIYALLLHIYKGFQDESPVHKEPFPNEIPVREGPFPKTPFWQWVTGRFSPENDPYRKKTTKDNK